MKSGTQLNLVFILLIVYFNGASGQESPCPDVFEYKFNGYNMYGAVTLPSVGRIRTIIAVRLTVTETVAKDNTGSIELLRDEQTLLEVLDDGGLLQYKINFPKTQQIPTINSIKLNKQEFCSNPPAPTIRASSTINLLHQFDPSGAEPRPEIQTKPLFEFSRPTIPPRPQPPREIDQPQPVWKPSLPAPAVENKFPPSSPNNVGTSWLQQMPTSATCGYTNRKGNEALQAIHTIIQGKDTTPGEYPWLVALLNPSQDFFCGGTLVSNKHVITAAHCMVFDWIYVELGRYKLKEKFEEGVILRQTNKFKIHDDYQNHTARSDIAIVYLSEEVRFSNKIKPICLWSFGEDSVGETGWIVGWGKDLSGAQTDEPKQTQVGIVSDDKCNKANTLFIGITSSKTYCAGGEGTGPCQGDSGGGMYTMKNNRWYLKGIISTSLGTGYSCDVESFAVYVNMYSFLDWLKIYLV